MSEVVIASGPLGGVRILDLTSVILGPYATQILADFGADVLKVEAPQGDSMRHVGPMRNPGMGHIFLNLNRNKRSVVLDLQRKNARAALLRLAETADVFVTNVRPAAMSRLGLTFEDVRKSNPRIVYVTATGYGAGGRYAGKPAYDDLIQGVSGICAISRDAWGDRPKYIPMAIADRTVGLYLANAISAALFHRERTGQGQEIVIPMFEVFAEYVLGDHLAGYTFEPPEGSEYYARLVSPYRKPYATKDGFVCALVYTDAHWRVFLEAIGRRDLIGDKRFASLSSRTKHIDEIYEFVGEVLKARTTEEWISVLDAADIPVMPMNDIKSLIEDPHLNDVGFIKKMAHPTEGIIRASQIPGTWSESQPSIRSLAPALGESTAEVLSAAGFSDAEISEINN